MCIGIVTTFTFCKREKRSPSDSDRVWELKFLRSPVEIMSSSTGRVRAIKLEVNRLEVSMTLRVVVLIMVTKVWLFDLQGSLEDARAVGTRKYEEIRCSLVLRSIGYKSLPIDPDLPFDTSKGLIPNSRGRVVNSSGMPIPGNNYALKMSAQT